MRLTTLTFINILSVWLIWQRRHERPSLSWRLFYLLGKNMLAECEITNTDLLPISFDIIVIGSGPVGVRLVQNLIKNNVNKSIAIFGDEPWAPYNRIHLSALVSGDYKEPSIYTQTDFSNITTFYNQKISEVIPPSKKLIDSQGNHFYYSDLVIATGSKPFIPKIDGVDLKNVYTFRDLNDAQHLMSRSVSTRKTVIIGGGLLGLEAAKAMQRFNTEVTVIEHNMWLMYSQLDERAGGYLKRYIEGLEINVLCSTRVDQITGTDKVDGIIFNNNKFLECDTVIIAAGIVPNIDLVKKSDIKYGKGIRVNDQLQTNDKNIYAIGECAEHRDRLYGLIAPGFEQAAALSLHLQGMPVNYSGSTSSTQMKVIDYSVFSIGEVGHSARKRETIIYQDHQKEVYRKITVINGKLRGFLAIGPFPNTQRIQKAVSKQEKIWPWHISRFKDKGTLWLEDDLENVADWPATAIVCNCTGVTRGQLELAKSKGYDSVEKLSECTGASTVCGSCRHLLSNFVNGNTRPTPVKAYKALLMPSLIVGFFSLFILLLPGLVYNNSIQAFNWDALWRDNLFKQISGYSILGISVLISFISVRKRFRNIIEKWDFAYWRIAHVALGVFIIIALLAHTGFRFGHNLNFYLMVVFSGLIFSGAIAGTGIASDHKLSRKSARLIRSFSVWSHIILLWPLPALLGFHILKTYFY